MEPTAFTTIKMMSELNYKYTVNIVTERNYFHSKGGDWSFKKYRSHRSSRVSQSCFLSGSVRLAVSIFNEAVSESRSRNLKSQKVSGSQRKTLVLLSRKVLNLPFATLINTASEFSRSNKCQYRESHLRDGTEPVVFTPKVVLLRYAEYL